MENASKALLMAAGILLSIMIISLGTYLFMTFGDYSKQVNEKISENKIAEFNSQFTKYEGHDCSPHDIVTIINLAKNSNEKYGYEQGQESYIQVIGAGVNQTSSTQQLNEFINQNVTNSQQYTIFNCSMQMSSTGTVNKILITKK